MPCGVVLVGSKGHGGRVAYEFGLVDHGGDDVFGTTYALVEGATVQLFLGRWLCYCVCRERRQDRLLRHLGCRGGCRCGRHGSHGGDGPEPDPPERSPQPDRRGEDLQSVGFVASLLLPNNMQVVVGGSNREPRNLEELKDRKMFPASQARLN